MDAAPSKELLAAFLVAVAASYLGIRAALRLRRRGGGAPLRHVVVAGWTSVARHLAASGTAPDLAALALAGYAPETGAAPVRAKLPAAVATVADALVLSLPEVQRAVVRRAGTPEAAAAALEELRALRGALAAAPDAGALGALWPDDPAELARAVAAYAKLAGVA